MGSQQCIRDPKIQDLLKAARFNRQAWKEAKVTLLSFLYLPGAILAAILGRFDFRISKALLSGNRLLLFPFHSHTPSKLAYLYFNQHIALHIAIRYGVENSYAEEQVAFWRAVTRLDEFTNNSFLRFHLGCSSGKLFARLARKEFPREIDALQLGNRELCELTGATPLQCDLRLAGTLLMSNGYAQSAPTKRYQQLQALGWWLGIRALRRYLDEIAKRQNIGNPAHAVPFLWHRLLRYLVRKRKEHVRTMEIELVPGAEKSILEALATAESEYLAVAQDMELSPQETQDALRRTHQVTLAPVWADYFEIYASARRLRRKHSAQVSSQ